MLIVGQMQFGTDGIKANHRSRNRRSGMHRRPAYYDDPIRLFVFAFIYWRSDGSELAPGSAEALAAYLRFRK